MQDFVCFPESGSVRVGILNSDFTVVKNGVERYHYSVEGGKLLSVGNFLHSMISDNKHKLLDHDFVIVKEIVDGFPLYDKSYFERKRV
jgi:hypothetical protein